MIPAYDDPAVWEGHASMVTEISQQLSSKPDAILCSVGGGGLLGGLIVGCQLVGWDDGERNGNNLLVGGSQQPDSPSDSARNNWVRLLLSFNVCEPRKIQQFVKIASPRC